MLSKLSITAINAQVQSLLPWFSTDVSREQLNLQFLGRECWAGREMGPGFAIIHAPIAKEDTELTISRRSFVSSTLQLPRNTHGCGLGAKCCLETSW